MTNKAKALAVHLEMEHQEQAVAYFPGTGTAFIIDDETSIDDLHRCIGAPIARAVLAARLRAIAAMLDE